MCNSSLNCDHGCTACCSFNQKAIRQLLHVIFACFAADAQSYILCDAGIQEMLERVSGEKGMVWDDFFGKLKKNNQWHVEVY